MAAFYVLELWYWLQRLYRQAFEQLRQIRADLVFANDWSALPLGWRLAARWNTPMILDLHEYAPLEWEEQWKWRLFAAPMTVYFLRHYAVHAAATLTVAPEIAQRYGEEFGFLPTVVLNAPEYVALEDHAVDPHTVRLIHHGGALRARNLELMIDTIRLCDRRYHLSFMLVGDEGYIRRLHAYADRVAPGRVTFLDPVAPDQIVPKIASFDIGIFLLQPTNYNYSIALPNKLFDFIHAGLAVCVGPSPGMAAFVREWRCGVVAPSFDPAEVAATLNRLGVDEIRAMRQAARVAAAAINASTEMTKVVELCNRLLRRAQAAR
ncbi:glycosyltransferase [Roseiflexus castenholzii]|uniref:glycosyltransferase n=1 Tax=Roseiflexus castenholzii TaxID=120962 RepID=UPI0000E76A81|nr:glycosyltransferase [Roseiflexus castenholzii]